MQPERGGKPLMTRPGADGPLTDWYRALPAGERLTLALSLSLTLHAAALLLPGPPPRAVHVPGVVRVTLQPGQPSDLLFAERRPAPSDRPLVPMPAPSMPLSLPPPLLAVSEEPPAVPLVASVPLASSIVASSPAVSLPGREGEGYFPAEALDVLAQPLQPIVFELPPAAPAGEVRLMLRVYINEQGGVDAVEAEQPDPSGVLESEARRVFEQARFIPARRHGLAVKSYKRIELRMQN